MAKAKKVVAVAAVLNMALLASIVAATQANSFVYTAEADHKPLIEAGLVEINPAMADESGSVATRATQKGIDQVTTAQNQAQAEVSTVVVKSAFVLESGVPLPTVSGRGRTGTTYPFDLMEVGQSFFVANSEDKPDAAKSLASTVSSATARFAVPKVPAEMETVKVRNYQTDESGKRVKNAEGKLVLLSETEEQRPVMVETRKFVVRSVTENGVGGARIWRTL